MRTEFGSVIITLVKDDEGIHLRRATSADARSAADVLIAARRAAVPSIPPIVHSEPDVRTWFETVVMESRDVWVAEVESSIVAVMVLVDGWVDQLYVAPGKTRQGIGAALIEHAKIGCADQLDLWTFESNVGAQRFYERHGFAVVDRTDGDNEEGEPDLRYRWSRPSERG